MTEPFESRRFLPTAVIDRITELRIAQAKPRVRRRRLKLARDGRLNILAADHPARAVTQVGQDPLAMADRQEFLARVARVLLSPTVDGVMASIDVLEELLYLDQLRVEAGRPSVLNDRLLIVSLNRGGLVGSAWELDDPMTGPEPEQLGELTLDGGKVLLRVCLDEPDSRRTLEAAAYTITRMNTVGLPTFLEPVPVTKIDGSWKVRKEAGALARLVGVASALGSSSRLLWLKLPWCPDYDLVARSTTLPILLLGGAARGDAAPLLDQVADGLGAGKNVRGALIGRNVLFPGLSGDPLAAATAVGGLIHEGWSVDRAKAALSKPYPMEPLV